MAYTPYLPNAYDTALEPHIIGPDYMKEVLFESPLNMFMGTGPHALINLAYKPKGTGLTDTVSLVNDLPYKNTIDDYDQITGKGAPITFYTDKIEAHQSTLPPVVLQGVQLTQYVTPVDIKGAMYPLLKQAHKKNIEYRLIKNATIDAYPNLAVGPDISRAFYNGIANNYNASILAGVTAMGGATADQSGCSVDSVSQMKFMAKQGYREGTVNGLNWERKINPYKMEMKGGYGSEFYVYFMNPATYRSMRNDPLWSPYFYRGMMEDKQPSLIHTSNLKGQFDNVLLVELAALGEPEFLISAGGNVAAWNLFCGAQAFSILFCGQPWDSQELTNHKNNLEVALTDIRGHRAHMFPSKRNVQTLVENALIHNFVQIA